MITGPLAEILRERRSAFNGRFNFFRSQYPLLDPGEVAGFLCHHLDPIIRRVHSISPAAAGPATETLYDLSLQMLGKGFLGGTSRLPALQASWLKVLNELAHLLAVDPGVFPGAVFNALLQLLEKPGVNAGLWTEKLVLLGRTCQDTERFLDLGRILAWRCGLVRLRSTALGLLAGLSDQDLHEVFSLSPVNGWSRDRFIERLHTFPWVSPQSAAPEPLTVELVFSGRLGSFIGHGGGFLRPPRVMCADHFLFVTDESSWWRIEADYFGGDLVPVQFSGGLPPFPTEGPVTMSAETLHWHSQSLCVPGVTETTGIAADAATVALTVPFSYSVLLFGSGASQE